MPTKKIAIDGPAGAGKSTIAKIVAKTLGIIYLDTGAMYRAVGLKAILSNCSPKDENSISEIVENIDIQIKYIDGDQKIFLDGMDVSNKIRTPEVSMAASDVATISKVREKLVDLQRNIAKENDVVMDGRDIGTHVLPDADLKIFLTASVEERARRRYEEMLLKGDKSMSFEEVKEDIRIRDENDINRKVSPLKKADDAVELDTTYMSIQDVADKIMYLLKEKS